MKSLAVAAAVLAVCFADTDDSNSLLQLQAQKRSSKQTLKINTWQKTLLSANATSARCGCFMTGCSMSLCPVCPAIECECVCTAKVLECPTCCNGDRDCIKKKIKRVAKKEIKRLNNADKHKISLEVFDRDMLKQQRKDQDQKWKHAKDMREHVLELRAEEDSQWKEQKESHKEIKESMKQRKKDLEEWSSDLQDVLEGVVHEINGGDIVEQINIDVTLPVCDCPGALNCPPTEECPMCHSKCPPCRPCESSSEDCESCEEDKPVLDAIKRFMNGHTWHVVPELPDPMMNFDLDFDESSLD